jgi:hypothetical protein
MSQEQENLEALYRAIQANPIAKESVNWERFSEAAEAVGLHYHPILGLMTKEAWESTKPMINGEES